MQDRVVGPAEKAAGNGWGGQMNQEGKNATRFFDEEDFTSDHDKVFLELLDKWQELLHRVPGVPVFTGIADGEIVGEPVAKGYPPVFPDALASGKFVNDHTKIPVRVTFITGTGTSMEGYPTGNGYGRGKRVVQFGCAGEGCQRGSYEEFESEPFSSWSASPEQKADYETRNAAALVKWEQEQTQSSKFWTTPCPGREFTAIFEIKPKVDSFGRVLRQLQLYRTRYEQERDTKMGYERRYGEWFRVILVTPDHRYDEQFLSQGFPVLHVPSPSGEPNLVPSHPAQLPL